MREFQRAEIARRSRVDRQDCRIASHPLLGHLVVSN
jgi:hypothetical protein